MYNLPSGANGLAWGLPWRFGITDRLFPKERIEDKEMHCEYRVGRNTHMQRTWIGRDQTKISYEICRSKAVKKKKTIKETAHTKGYFI